MKENATKFVLVTLQNEIEEGKRFSNKKKDLMTSNRVNVRKRWGNNIPTLNLLRYMWFYFLFFLILYVYF